MVKKSLIPARRLLYCINYGNLWEPFFENPIQITDWFYFELQKDLQMLDQGKKLIRASFGSFKKTQQKLVDFRSQVSGKRYYHLSKYGKI